MLITSLIVQQADDPDYRSWGRHGLKETGKTAGVASQNNVPQPLFVKGKCQSILLLMFDRTKSTRKRLKLLYNQICTILWDNKESF